MNRWNPLDEPAPVVPRCKTCQGKTYIPVNSGGWFNDKTKIPCAFCNATGHAQPPACEACGGSGEADTFPDTVTSVATLDGSPCPTCSGTGRAPWGVLVTVDVFGSFPAGTWPDIEAGVADPVEYGDAMKARWFATIAAHPDRHFYLSLESVASAERAREWMSKCCAHLLIDEIWCRWPLPNLTLLAVARDQASLEEILESVLQVPAAAHGLYLRGLDGAISLDAGPVHLANGGYGVVTDALTILLLDEVDTSEGKSHLEIGFDIARGAGAAAQARDAGVRVVEVSG